jgi:hypothetical protein
MNKFDTCLLLFYKKNSTQAVRRGRQYQFTAQKKSESPADIWYGLGLATHV